MGRRLQDRPRRPGLHDGSVRAGWGASGSRRAGLLALGLLMSLPVWATEWAEEARRPRGLLIGVARPGPALREGLRVWEAGDPEAAAEIFGEVSARHRLVADHATRLRIEALLDAEQPENAAAVASAFRVAYPESPLRPAVDAAAGDVFEALGREAEARDAWRRAAEGDSSGDRRAELRAAIARSFERSKLLEEAAQEWLELWQDQPSRPAAKPAGEALERLEAALGRSLRSSADWLRRGDALYRARHNEKALEAYDTALGGSLSARTRRDVRRQRAFTLFRLRRYPEAEEAFAALGHGQDERFWRARCAARRGDVPRAIRAFEKIGGERGSLAVRARYLAGVLLQGRDRIGEARTHYAAVARSGSAGLRQAVRWRLGWIAYQEGDWATAAENFGELERLDSDPVSRLKPRYWQARALEKLEAPEAPGLFLSIATEFPLSYYGWRSALRIGPSPQQRVEPDPPRLGEPRLDETGLERVRVLLEAGLDAEADVEARRLAAAARSLTDRLTVAGLYVDAGNPNRAQRIAVDGYVTRLAQGPSRGQEDLWWYAWPLAFAGPVDEALARAPGVDRELVLAVMREESGYRPEVISPVGARGLMQIMPTTGERLARDLGLNGFDPDQLFVARTNVRLGTYYLRELLAQFDGRPSAAIGSYNAGPAAVGRWLKERPGIDDDEWVEAIPYDETRKYVQRVLRSRHAYRVLY